MGKKGGGKGVNTKKEAGNAIKAENKAAKDSKKRAAAEAKEAAEWAKGSNQRGKARADQAEQKKKDADAKRAEKERLRAEEEKQLAKVKPVKAYQRKAEAAKKMGMKKNPNASIHTVSARGTAEEIRKTAEPVPMLPNQNAETDAVEASGLENVLDALDIKDGKILDRHPERRQKAAYAAYEERMMVILKGETPHLKRSQYKERIFELWKKSPENPRNQETLAYNAKPADSAA